MNNLYKNNEKITTKVEPSNDEDVVSKAYLDTSLSKREGHLTKREIDYEEKKVHNDKDANQSNNEVKIEKTLKIAGKNYISKELFDEYDDADEV